MSSTQTPVKATALKEAPIVDSPGTWRHPRLNEITRRRNATTFTEKNVRVIAYNVASLLALWSLRVLVKMQISPQSFSPTFRLYTSWAWFVIQLIPFVKIILACLPLVRTEDNLNDIPLTAAQRKLLGLPPSSAVPTPDAKFSTPPRYSRTPSIGGSIGSRGSFTSSPLSGKGSPLMQSTMGGSGSPYGGSPSASPLQTRSGSGLGFSTNGRRSSLGGSGSFGASTGASLFSDPGSPSPSGGKRTTVGLNSKWLYEKGRRSSGNAWAQ